MVSFQAVRGTSGFEALRLLAKEFSLRSRAEAAFFRSEFMSKTFKAQSGPTQISDLVRLHASGEGYTDYRTAALEVLNNNNNVCFRSLVQLGAHGSGRQVHALEGDASWEGYYGYEEEQDY